MTDALRTELEALVERMLRVAKDAPSQTMTQFFAFEIKRLLASQP
jgi:hypothetical protein